MAMRRSKRQWPTPDSEDHRRSALLHPLQPLSEGWVGLVRTLVQVDRPCNHSGPVARVANSLSVKVPRAVCSHCSLWSVLRSSIRARASAMDRNQAPFRHSWRSRTLKNSMNALFLGLPGLEKPGAAPSDAPYDPAPQPPDVSGSPSSGRCARRDPVSISRILGRRRTSSAREPRAHLVYPTRTTRSDAWTKCKRAGKTS